MSKGNFLKAQTHNRKFGQHRTEKKAQAKEAKAKREENEEFNEQKKNGSEAFNAGKKVETRVEAVKFVQPVVVKEVKVGDEAKKPRANKKKKQTEPVEIKKAEAPSEMIETPQISTMHQMPQMPVLPMMPMV